jgi:hypothetical protein
MVCDGFLHLLKIDAEPFAFDNEFLELLFKEFCSFGFGGRGVLGDDRDCPWADFKEACINETSDYFVRGIRIDFELFTENADRRKFVARTELAGNYGLGGGVDNLLVNGSAGFEFHVKRNHLVYYIR